MALTLQKKFTKAWHLTVCMENKSANHWKEVSGNQLCYYITYVIHVVGASLSQFHSYTYEEYSDYVCLLYVHIKVLPCDVLFVITKMATDCATCVE